MICEKCGSTIPEHSNFCTACGAPLAAEEAVPAAAFFTAAPDLSANDSPAAPEQKAPAVPETPAVQMPDDNEPAIVADEAFFAAETPAPQPAAVPLVQVSPVPVQAAPAVPEVKEKKSRAGLIIGLAAAAVIVLGVLAAGLLTNWFRTDKAKPQGPMDELKAVFSATFPEDSANGTADVRLNVEGLSFNFPVQYDIDREHPDESAVYAKISVMGQDLELGYYQGKLIVASNGFVNAEELDEELPGLDSAVMKTKDGKYDTESYFRKTMDADAFEELAEETDFDRLNEAYQELEDNFNDEAWLTEFCGYTRTEDGDTVIYSFSPAPEFMDEYMRIMRPAFKNQDFGDEMTEELDDVLPLSEMKLELVAVKGKLDRINLKFEVEGEHASLSVSWSDVGRTEVDRDALQELLDNESDYFWVE